MLVCLLFFMSFSRKHVEGFSAELVFGKSLRYKDVVMDGVMDDARMDGVMDLVAFLFKFLCLKARGTRRTCPISCVLHVHRVYIYMYIYTHMYIYICT